jgi:hypothetical protein
MKVIFFKKIIFDIYISKRFKSAKKNNFKKFFLKNYKILFQSQKQTAVYFCN